MTLPLEDFYEDTLKKAKRGLGKSEEDLARETGLPLETVTSVLGGSYDPAATAALASALGLAPERVCALAEKSYVPAPVEPVEGLRQFNTVFDDMTVNAYLVWDPASREAAVFDTGSDVSPILAAAAELGLTIRTIYITHAHGDHIFDLDRLVEKTGAPVWTPEREVVDGAQTFTAGKTFEIGSLSGETRLTWGHAPGGVSYIITGLKNPVAICGDAIFAGSMGGGAVSYADALRTNREELLSLPDETILCPGHGPLTTIGEQRLNNPFFP